MTQTLTLKLLKTLTADAAAIRGKAILEPAGGPHDKIFPPSHAVDKNETKAGAKYAFEERRIAGAPVACVLLDSVQSQANRMEEALQALWQDKRISLPVIAVDFGFAREIGTVTSLSAPHRIADAILRDSQLDGRPFRFTELGKSFTDASPKDASTMLKVCPTGLVWGIWDSTGPKGGLGAKFARVVTSEIVGIGALRGSKTSSRIDPVGIMTKAAEIYESTDPEESWTHDAKTARQDKKGAVKLKDGKTSNANHSNVPPTIDIVAGGVTIDRAEQTVVISLAGLRKLGFGSTSNSHAARTVLAALALIGVLAAQDRGHDLRSRCLLVPVAGKALTLEAIHKDGKTTTLDLTLDEALTIYQQAVAELPEELAWKSAPGEPLATLKPSPKLTHLVMRSRELAAAGAIEEEA